MVSRRGFMKCLAAGAAAMSTRAAWSADGQPNIVLILADDIGYGDLGCYGAKEVKTPNLDRLGHEGCRFTDAHATASVCTPTRYSLLTGQYAWRNPKGDHILSGVAPLSIPLNAPTMPGLLHDTGYRTGLVGKWHLGLGTEDSPVDYNGDIAPGPCDVGFDCAFFVPATNDRVPCVYVENRRVVGLDPSDPIEVSYKDQIGNDPLGRDHPEMLKMKSDMSHSNTIVNGISRIGYMSGGNTARWVDEDMAGTLTSKALDYIETNTSQPFFLLFSPIDIHEPMAPNPRFRGTSGCGSRGDAIHELDWCVGQVLDKLDDLGLTGKTLVIFSSDNGGALKDTYDDGTNALHAKQPPNGALRGEKSSLYEGGHRVPFLAKWPDHIKPGTASDAVIGLVDMAATFTALVGGSLPDDGAPDSFNVLNAILGKSRSAREHLVLQNNGSRALALREGDWKFITNEFGDSTMPEKVWKELYNLRADPAESKNVADANPERVRIMRERLRELHAGPRTRA